MYTAKMDDMVKGWFVGNFKPSVYQTDAVEVAVKRYRKGDIEHAHYHKLATELTVIVSGRVKMFGKEWDAGDVIVVEPGDITAFEALEDAVNVVVKIPGAKQDKYLMEE